MITLNEYLKGKSWKDIPEEHQKNIVDLLVRVNIIRANYGRAMNVTSGYRSEADQLRVYAVKGITDKSKIPMLSKHLSGQAIDIADPQGDLYKWCKANETILSHAGVYCEEGTVGWVHFQTTTPRSGNRWFLP